MKECSFSLHSLEPADSSLTLVDCALEDALARFSTAPPHRSWPKHSMPWEDGGIELFRGCFSKAVVHLEEPFIFFGSWGYIVVVSGGFCFQFLQTSFGSFSLLLHTSFFFGTAFLNKFLASRDMNVCGLFWVGIWCLGSFIGGFAICWRSVYVWGCIRVIAAAGAVISSVGICGPQGAT
eukprot:4778-Ditylum_brightwellii.AAC.1